MFDWVHIWTIGGPIHADDVLSMEVSIHYTIPMGSALSSASSQLLRYHALPCGTKWSSRTPVTSDPERTRSAFPIWEIPPIHVHNRLREPHYHVYNLHAWLLQPVSNTDPIVDPEEHASKFVAEDDMSPLAYWSIDVFLGPMMSHKFGPYS